MKRKQKFKDVLCALLLFLFFILIMILSLYTQPKGHYEGTETMQPDGNYYIWVED